MSISIATTNASALSQSVGVNNGQQNRQNFKALFSALQSGDLTAAQQAYSAITGTTSSASNAADSSSANNPLAQIGAALQSGDLSGAQKAAQSFFGGHHHHHHGGGFGQSANASSASGSVIPTSSSPAVGTVLNTSA